jgi:Type VI secretion system/phage-baseplate injector OB domain
MSCQRFFGKYRGTVINNIDPKSENRIQATVPSVSQLMPTSWCTPCLPLAGRLSGASLVPQVGSGVWIEFEGGDPDYPIWTGCFYGSSAERPRDASGGTPVTPSIVFQGQFLHSITVNDLPPPAGGIELKSVGGAKIIVNDIGITIDNGKGASITLFGPIVKINNTSLVITG